MQNVYVTDSSKWRVWAKAVAIIDLFYLSIVLVAVWTLTLLPDEVTDVVESELSPEVVWFLLAIFSIQIAASLLTSVQLLKATQWRRELNDAYKRSQYWMNVSIVFLVIGTIYGIYQDNLKSNISTGISVILRITFMNIVFLFMMDVKDASVATQNQQQMIQRI